MRRALVGLLATWLACGVAIADLPEANLQGGLPVELDDAVTSDPWSRQLQGSARFEREHDARDAFTVEPDLQLGLPWDVQIDVTTPLEFGSADHTGSRDLRVALLHTLWHGRGPVPSTAVLVRGELPTGRNAAGIDTRLELIATWPLATSPLAPRVHVNASWDHQAGRRADERADAYRVVVGYDRELWPQTRLVVDALRQQASRRDETDTVLEAGVRWAIGTRLVLSVGGGPGMGDHGILGRATIGLEVQL